MKSARYADESRATRSIFILLTWVTATSAAGNYQLGGNLPTRTPRPLPRDPALVNVTGITLDSFKKDIVFYERLFTLIVRTCARVIHWTGEALLRLFNFPPRVAVVSLQGVIAADDLLQLDLLGRAPDDPLLFGGTAPFTSASRERNDVINLARCDKLLTRAFQAALARLESSRSCACTWHACSMTLSHFAAHIFQAPGVRAVCILVNSPGGSPAQSSLIYERLRALRKRYPRIPLLAFVEDSACSGGYYIAAAADEIIADPNSVVGARKSSNVMV